jgi:hypothetical protein
MMKAQGIQSQLLGCRSKYMRRSARRSKALQHNNSLNPTRDSMVVVMISAAQVEGCSRGRVNSGVMSPRRMESMESPAAPQLNDSCLAWIMREAG